MVLSGASYLVATFHAVRILDAGYETDSFDAVQKEQILVVNRDLQAAETPNGHGDSFWSIALACLAADKLEGPSSYTGVGDAQVFSGKLDTESQPVGDHPAYNNDMPIDEDLSSALGDIYAKSVEMYGKESI